MELPSLTDSCGAVVAAFGLINGENFASWAGASIDTDAIADPDEVMRLTLLSSPVVQIMSPLSKT